jgi:GAF domain-containing protein
LEQPNLVNAHSAPVKTRSGIRRLTTLHRYQILDGVSDRTYDDIVKLAAHAFETPIAAISIIEADQHSFKTSFGLEVPLPVTAEPFCAHTMRQQDLLVVNDTQADVRFAANPLVTQGQGIRFYAGAPLVTPDGLGLGALCVMDFQPREVTPRVLGMLHLLARMVMTTMDLHRVTDELASEVLKVRNLTGLLPICAGCKNIRNDSGYWQRVESYVQEHSQAEFTHGMCPECAKKYFPNITTLKK